MTKNKRSFFNKKGISLLELMIVVLISGIVSYGASSLLSGVREREARSSADVSVASLIKLLTKASNQSLQTLAVSKFNTLSSYKLRPGWDYPPAPFFPAANLNLSPAPTYTPDPLINFNVTAKKEALKNKINAEPDVPYKQTALTYLNSAAGFSAGSFELFVQGTEAGTAAGSIEFTGSSVLISRCIPETAVLAGDEGNRINLNAPVSSMFYLLSLKVKPFLIPYGREWVVRCVDPAVPADLNKPYPTTLAERDAEFKKLSSWRVVVFQIKLDASLSPTSILELNAPSEISPNFGAGFMLTFNEDIRVQVDPTNGNKPFPYAPPVKLNIFVIYDRCLGTSFGRRPSMEIGSCLKVRPNVKSTDSDATYSSVSSYLGQALDIKLFSVVGSLNIDARQGTGILIGTGKKISN